MDRLLQDLRFAVRLLWKDRNFSITTIATLALWPGGQRRDLRGRQRRALEAAAVPGARPADSNVQQISGAGVDAGGSNGVPDYFDRKRDMAALEETALFREAGVTISGSGLCEAERIQAMLVTPSSSASCAPSRIAGSSSPMPQGELGQEKVVILTHGFLAAAVAAAMTRSARTCVSAASSTRSSA
jgi:hypothetical protein